MGRKPTVNLNLPAGMRVKRGAKGKAWYYLDTGRGADGKRHWEPLGDDFPEALRKYADRVRTYDAPAVTVPEILAAWQAATLPGRPAGTQKDIISCMKSLMKFFGTPPAPLADVEPHHIRQYLEWRPAKIQANREIAWFSAAWNWARGNGKTSRPNPTLGIKRNREKGRSIYIEDEEMAAIMRHADVPLREAIELAYLIGQRPGDLRAIMETDIRDGSLNLRQDKTGARVRIEIIGKLAELVERIRERKRGIRGIRSLHLIVDEKGRPMSRKAIRGRFGKARESAAAVAATPGEAEKLRSIQFRDFRAKAASDVENLERARRLLGHTSQSMTEHYVRKRRGDKVAPVK